MRKVKNFVLDSSIEILFYDLPQKELEIIKSLEIKLKRKLDISKLFDYLDRSDEDISNILKQKFSDETAIKYTKLLKARLREYESALKDLGISI